MGCSLRLILGHLVLTKCNQNLTLPCIFRLLNYGHSSLMLPIELGVPQWFSLALICTPKHLQSGISLGIYSGKTCTRGSVRSLSWFSLGSPIKIQLGFLEQVIRILNSNNKVSLVYPNSLTHLYSQLELAKHQENRMFLLYKKCLACLFFSELL